MVHIIADTTSCLYAATARRGDKHLSVLHAGAPKLAQAMAARLSAGLGLPPAIVTHGGPGVMGVGFSTDEA
jgi:hypothetical protein